MSNLTISVDDALIKQARVRAIQQGTSVSAKVREFLQQYANESDAALQKQRDDATGRLMAVIESATLQTRSPSAAGLPGPAPTQQRSLRDQLYEDGFRARDASDASDARKDSTDSATP